jgi:hypothetical protein
MPSGSALDRCRLAQPLLPKIVKWTDAAQLAARRIPVRGLRAGNQATLRDGRSRSRRLLRVGGVDLEVHDPVHSSNVLPPRFYRDVFGWEIKEWVIDGVQVAEENRYWLVTTGSEGTPGINTVHRPYIGNFFASLDMMGVTLTLMKTDDELKTFIDLECNSMGLKQC